MAELLLRVVDRGPAAGHSKAGDVVVVQPDGWVWTPAERTNPQWRIIAVPGVPVPATLFGYLLSERDQRLMEDPKDLQADPIVNPNLQQRAFGIVIANLPPAARNALLAPRTGNGVLTISRAAIDAVRARRLPLPIGKVIG